jgi:hypothetical protein
MNELDITGPFMDDIGAAEGITGGGPVRASAASLMRSRLQTTAWG